jgi:ketosteroid isomerase-like protein
MSVDHNELIRELTAILGRGDWSALSTVMAPDAVMEFPQSGEVFEGIDNIRGQFADYPQMPEGHISAVEVAAGGPTYALSPNYTVISMGDSGRSATAALRARYPDGSLWWLVVVYDTDGERLSRFKIYFAPDFEPAEWRSKYRLPLHREGASG